MSAVFSCADMGLSGHVRAAKPGAALMCSMLDVQAA
jgi:hypothetical protein